MKIQTLFTTSLLAFFCFASFANVPYQPTPAGIKLNVRMYLQGAMIGVRQPSNLMRDDLRAAGLVPMQEPYSALGSFSHYGDLGGKERIASPEVLAATGPDAIVDWVFVELRHPEFQKIVLSTRSALLQRDGDVVDMDGVSPLHFPGLEPGSYLVAAHHRNHLGVMTNEAYDLSGTPQLVDFTDPKTHCFGNHPLLQVHDKMALFAGDINHDGEVSVEGPENDRDRLFFHVYMHPDNVNADKAYIVYGYSDYDVNMDGKTIYQGPTSDGAYLSFDIVFFWRYNCPQVDKDCRLVEQLP